MIFAKLLSSSLLLTYLIASCDPFVAAAPAIEDAAVAVPRQIRATNLQVPAGYCQVYMDPNSGYPSTQTYMFASPCSMASSRIVATLENFSMVTNGADQSPVTGCEGTGVQYVYVKYSSAYSGWVDRRNLVNCQPRLPQVIPRPSQQFCGQWAAHGGPGRACNLKGPGFVYSAAPLSQCRADGLDCFQQCCLPALAGSPIATCADWAPAGRKSGGSVSPCRTQSTYVVANDMVPCTDDNSCQETCCDSWLLG